MSKLKYIENKVENEGSLSKHTQKKNLNSCPKFELSSWHSAILIKIA